MSTGKNLSSRGSTAIALVAVVCCVRLFSLFKLFEMSDFLAGVASGALDIDAKGALDREIAAANVVVLVAFIASWIVFWRWCKQAHAQAHTRGAVEQRHQGWKLLWSWLVPIMSFVWPYQMMDDIYAGSDPEQRRHVLVRVWWLFWVLSHTVAWLSMYRSGPDATPQDLAIAVRMDMVSCVALVVSGVLMVTLIARIDRMQAQWSTS